MSKKILILIPSPVSFKNFLLETSLKLLDRGYEIEIACAIRSDFKDYHPSFTYHFIHFDREVKLWNAIKSALQLRKLVNKIQPDIIHAHFSSSALILALARNSKFPFCIATIQGLRATASSNILQRVVFTFAEKIALSRMDKSFVLTDDDYVLFRNKVNNLYLQNAKGFGVNLDKWSPQLPNNELRQELGIDANDFVLIYIGRLVSFKGFGLALRVLERLNKTNSKISFKLLVCGAQDLIRGMDLTLEEQNIWENNKNIIKVGFTNELKKYIALSHLNIFPSKREGMPVNLMESIAMGVPCITSNSRGCRHVVMNGINGIIIDSFDEKDYVDRIVELANNRALLNNFNEGCLKTRFFYSQEFYIEELNTLYKD